MTKPTQTIDEYTVLAAIEMIHRFEEETGIDPWWPISPVTDDKPDWKSYLDIVPDYLTKETQK